MARRTAKPLVELVNGIVHIDGRPWSVPWLRVRRLLGQGANGVVFEAHDSELDRMVAVKVWFRKGSDASIRRARAEARKLATVPSAKIVAIHHFGTAAAMPFAVMELFPGDTLKDWLHAMPRPFVDRREVWNQISDGLRVLYRAGHQHGDPHWGNILVREGTADVSLDDRIADKTPAPLTVKLTDMGASALWADRDRLAQREMAVVWETATRMFSAERIGSVLDVTVLEADRTLDAVDAFVEVERLVLDVVDSADEYGQASARFGIAIHVTEAPFFRLGPLLDSVRSHGASKDTIDALLAEILSSIIVAEHGVAATDHSAPHHLALVEEQYMAWRERLLESPAVDDS